MVKKFVTATSCVCFISMGAGPTDLPNQHLSRNVSKKDDDHCYYYYCYYFISLPKLLDFQKNF